MKRIALIVLSLGACSAMMFAVLTQQNQLTELRTEQSRVLERQTTAENEAVVPPTSGQSVAQKSHSPSMELLKLRGEVGRLSSRKRELAGAAAERVQHQRQTTTRQTNAPGVFKLPPCYIKRSEAKFLGYNAPEETIQSFLWAIQNRDAAKFLESLSPDQAKQFEISMESRESTEEFFKEANSLPGMHIIGREAGENGEIVLKVEIMPGDEPQPKIRFRQIGGQWKMASGF